MLMLKHIVMWPFLPQDVRLRLRHQRLEGEAAKRMARILATPDISVTLVRATDGGTPGRDMRLDPKLPAGLPSVLNGRTESGQWCSFGGMEWDGQRVTVIGAKLNSGVWMPTSGGFRPGFDAVEAFRTVGRPAGSGEWSNRVAAIATVGLVGHRLQRILFLDEEARELAWIPAQGFAEDDLLRFAEAAGIAYRRYAFTLAKFSSLRVSPSTLCEALFPRSARRVKLVASEFDDVSSWYSER